MKTICMASVTPNAGKSTVALGIAQQLDASVGYMKPLGDNQIYKKKRLVDYDAALFKKVFAIDQPIEEFTIGFHYSKIAHAFPDIPGELTRRAEALSEGRDVFLVEGSYDLAHGRSLGLDTFSVAHHLNAGVVLVLTGEASDMLDDLVFAHRVAQSDDIAVNGAVLDRPKEEDLHRVEEALEERNIPLLGVMPHLEELDTMQASYLADKLFAKVVAGSGGLGNPIQHILIGALSASQIQRHPDFKKKNKLIITGGDRTDVIAASLKDPNTSCILLTNNIVPPSNLTARADKNDIPLLSVRLDTYTAAQKVEGIESIILPDEAAKVENIKAAAEQLDLSSLEE
ncbi:MAG: AAA family ATPase [Candidatus Thermoplasmatota archaeon]|nr:AAA family ATPase [Candidatus Thermoplasmatota archaeon]